MLPKPQFHLNFMYKVSILLGVFMLSFAFLFSIAYVENITLVKPIEQSSAKFSSAAQPTSPPFVDGSKFLKPEYRVLNADSSVVWASGPPSRKILYKSYDHGDNWRRVYNFKKGIEAVHITPKGTLLVSVSINPYESPAGGELWRSDDGDKSFTHVLDFKSGASKWFSISSDDEGYVYAAEYGFKALPDNSRRIYRSKDDGLTWQLVYQPKERFDYHNHKNIIDSNNHNIIYQATGDWQNHNILKSTDRGNTWKKIASGFHPVSALQFGDKILWGLDDYPKPGIISLDTKTGRIKYAFNPPAPYAGSVYDLMYFNGIIYAGFQSYKEHSWPGSIFISKDQGKTWEKWIEWDKKDGQEIFFYKFSHDDQYGYVWVTLPINDKSYSKYASDDGHYKGTIRFPLLKLDEIKTN